MNNRGRNPRGRSSPRAAAANSTQRYSPVRTDGSSDDVTPGQKDSLSHTGGRASRTMSRGTPSSVNSYWRQRSLPDVKDVSSGIGKLELTPNLPLGVDHSSEERKSVQNSGSQSKKDFPSLSAQSDPSDKNPCVVKSQSRRKLDMASEIYNMQDIDYSSPSKPLLSTEPWTEDGSSERGKQSGQTSNEKAGVSRKAENSDSMSLGGPFDICLKKPGNVVTLKPSLLVKNRERRNEIKRSKEGQTIEILRPGMVLLRSYISSKDQVSIVKKCSELGIGCGGFYRPGYRDGARLHLQMMCLGMNWDPDTGNYSNTRPMDGANPPVIPNEFHQLVKAAIHDSHAHLQEHYTTANVEKIIPSMSPNICIVNFYANSGKLGLHQDKDESAESLDRGSPVVSFSIGDSAEFLYGDERDAEKAEKVVLESGDVLIFGGKSRRVFHGVTKINAGTAPKGLLEETDLRSGRLNLTFRQF